MRSGAVFTASYLTTRRQLHSTLRWATLTRHLAVLKCLLLRAMSNSFYSQTVAGTPGLLHALETLVWNVVIERNPTLHNHSGDLWALFSGFALHKKKKRRRRKKIRSVEELETLHMRVQCCLTPPVAWKIEGFRQRKRSMNFFLERDEKLDPFTIRTTLELLQNSSETSERRAEARIWDFPCA